MIPTQKIKSRRILLKIPILKKAFGRKGRKGRKREEAGGREGDDQLDDEELPRSATIPA